MHSLQNSEITSLIIIVKASDQITIHVIRRNFRKYKYKEWEY